MTGEKRYWEAVRRSAERANAELRQYVNKEIDRLSDGVEHDKASLIEVMTEMQEEIDRCHAILREAGIDGAAAHEFYAQSQAKQQRTSFNWPT
jgi:hypothetical protein